MPLTNRILGPLARNVPQALQARVGLHAAMTVLDGLPMNAVLGINLATLLTKFDTWFRV